jgi:hypothetical protein
MLLLYVSNQIPIQRFPIPTVLGSKLILFFHFAITRFPLDSAIPTEYSHFSNTNYRPYTSKHPSLYSKSRLYTVCLQAFPNTQKFARYL